DSRVHALGRDARLCAEALRAAAQCPEPVCRGVLRVLASRAREARDTATGLRHAGIQVLAMLLHVPGVLSAESLVRVRERLDDAPWADGRATAGHQSSQVKRNEQLPEDCAAARELGDVVLEALRRNALFFAAALPRRIYPPLFNRYRGGMAFGSHVDNAIRFHPPSGERFRTDLSATLFLVPPEDYDGGELVVEDTYGMQRVKLPAGDMVLYP